MKRSQHHHVLQNGLTLIGECVPWRRSVALGFFIGTGARDETAKESGVSHFLEHMAFRGTQKRTALELTYSLGNLAAQSNAYTTEEQTVYYGGVLPEFFPHMHDLLCDMMQPGLSDEDFHTEKNVILEEIALYEDRPSFLLFDQSTRDYFHGHPAGNSILGTTESVGKLTRAGMHDYFVRRYRPSNMILAACGAFDWDVLVKLSELACGHWEDGPVARELPPFRYEPVRHAYRKDRIQQSHILLVAPGCHASAPDRYIAALALQILGDSGGSRLYWELIDSGLADSAGAESDEKMDLGTVSLYASCAPAMLDQIRTILYRLILSGEDFSAEELERARNKALARIVFDSESTIGSLLALGTEYQYRRVLHSLEEEIKLIRDVTLHEVNAFQQSLRTVQWSEFTLVPD